jgi:hypothetical protein
MVETRSRRTDIKLDEKCCADLTIYRVYITLISSRTKKHISQNALRCDSPQTTLEDNVRYIKEHASST